MQNLTFTKYVYDEYYNEIFEKLNDFICSNKSRLDLYSDSIELDDFSIGGVSFSNGNDSKILFSLSVVANIEVIYKSKYDNEQDSVNKWLTLSCSANLTDSGLSDFEILSTNEYSKSSHKRENPLTQHLIPYISSKDLDKVATDFLNKYCPEALKTPMPLPIESIINKMNLTCYEAPLKEGTFGMTYFSSNKAKVYDENKSIKEITANPGTILINSNSSFMTSVGSKNNTIIHECVHWTLHHNFFLLQKLLDPTTSAITCDIVDKYKPDNKEFDNAFSWMEWQANSLAPKILMPNLPTRQKFGTLMSELANSKPELRLSERMELAISELANFFHVSKIAAKIRVIELGYKQAIGTFNYVNNTAYPPIDFDADSITEDQTFIIDRITAIILSRTSPELIKVLNEGSFIYTNGMFVINHPKYVSISGSNINITDYALRHADECCLVFDRKTRVNTNYDDSFYRRCFLCRNVSSEDFIEASFNPNAGENEKVADSAAEIKKIMDEATKIASSFNDIPGTFAGTLRYHMNRKNITEETLAARADYSVPIISGYLNNNSQNKPLPAVLALCIGLNLQPVYAYDLLTKAGYNIRNSMTPENMFFSHLIDNHHMETLPMWNSKLREANIKQMLPKNKENNLFAD